MLGMTEDSSGHEPLSDAAVTGQDPKRPGDLLVWLGGGDRRDIADTAERSVYQSTGFMVLLAALAAWGVSTAAAVTAGGVAVPAAAALTLLAGLFVGALGRVLATAPGQRGTLLGLGLVAALVGVVLGELAALTIFTGPVSEQLNNQADRAAASVAGGEHASRLAQLRAERAGLDDRVAKAGARRDAALLVARCEFRPAPGCPPQLITGEPGRGAEADQARAELAGSDTDLAAARAERDRRGPELDGAIAAAGVQVDRDRDAAERLARADNGFVARWEAMNDYTTTGHFALIPRLGAWLVMVLLTAAPLLLRLWRGQTDQERLAAARRIRRQAEEDADTAIAVRRAQVRAELELRRQEELLAIGTDHEADRPALTGRIDAEIVDDAPAVAARSERAALPAGAGAETALALPETALAVPEEEHPLEVSGNPLPAVGRAVSSIAAVFVPPPIARFVDGIRPARAVHTTTTTEDVEEIEFSMKRKRTVTVTEEVIEEEPEVEEIQAIQEIEELPEIADAVEGDEPRRRVVLTRVQRDRERRERDRLERDRRRRKRALSGGRARELPADSGPASLTTGVRELPSGEDG